MLKYILIAMLIYTGLSLTGCQYPPETKLVPLPTVPQATPKPEPQLSVEQLQHRRKIQALISELQKLDFSRRIKFLQGKINELETTDQKAQNKIQEIKQHLQTHPDQDPELYQLDLLTAQEVINTKQSTPGNFTTRPETGPDATERQNMPAPGHSRRATRSRPNCPRKNQNRSQSGPGLY